MSDDMLKADTKILLDDRKRKLLQTAVDIIATQGYAKLTMRALARSDGIKLGALQYHFPTWEALLSALARYIGDSYENSFAALKDKPGGVDLDELVLFALDDIPGIFLHSDNLFPQLWAMAQIEPVMAEMLDVIYTKYLSRIEDCLIALKHPSPRAEALALLSLIEGSAVFVGENRRWHKDAAALQTTILEIIRSRYGT
ncbi:TetR/AcrR family transcriptional regulator [Alphaproteobacteria bacterium]|nr:TetR/AcrR family transcriptional regulator [Alphaproteobacteria bacterium]MDB2523171.1 TetR/AcrR family transcriptional regulator [Alphaproteobacteria bacterium]MDB2641645.1 TetR/AcrR family transcriptional regulator [Alphaproteobacteria bacterium]